MTVRMGLFLAPLDHPQCQKVRVIERKQPWGGRRIDCELTPEFDQCGLGIPSDARIALVMMHPKGDALEFLIDHPQLRDMEGLYRNEHGRLETRIGSPIALSINTTQHDRVPQVPTVRPRWDGDRFMGWEVLK